MMEEKKSKKIKTLQYSCILNATQQLCDEEKTMLIHQLLEDSKIIYFKSPISRDIFESKNFFWRCFRNVKMLLKGKCVTQNHYNIYMYFCRKVLENCKMSHYNSSTDKLTIEMGGSNEKCDFYHRTKALFSVIHSGKINFCITNYNSGSNARLETILFDIITGDLDELWMDILLFLFDVDFSTENEVVSETFKNRLKQILPSNISAIFSCVDPKQDDSFYKDILEKALSKEKCTDVR